LHLRHAVTIALLCGASLSFAQEKQENYREIFGKDYEKALAYLSKSTWIDSIARAHGLIPKEVKAVVFPELIRFNSIQDKIETFALETLYVQYGKTYANFSIGPFQVKPSFAENIEIDLLAVLGPQRMLQEYQLAANDTLSTESNRSKRVKRLKNPLYMTEYICAFFQRMEKTYPSLRGGEKIRFFASAYNSDYRKSASEIRAFERKRFFQTGLGNRPRYSYAAIAVYYFNGQE
jgi:hypothetical protein